MDKNGKNRVRETTRRAMELLDEVYRTQPELAARLEDAILNTWDARRRAADARGRAATK